MDPFDPEWPEEDERCNCGTGPGVSADDSHEFFCATNYPTPIADELLDEDVFHAFVMDNIQESGRFNETENDK